MNEGSRPRTYFCIVNPMAGSGALGRRWSARIRPLIAEKIGDFAFALTEGAGHATELARQALLNGHQTIIAMGGDGTINEVVNGFFINGKPVRPKAKLGILPFGSGGDFARTARLPKDYRKALDLIASGNARPVDVGVAEYGNPDMPPRHFINIANAGVVAQIMLKVNVLPRWLPALTRYLGGTLQGFLTHADCPVRLTVDGTRIMEVKLTDLVVANGRFFGRGMQVAPSALIDDGLFDVAILKDVGATRFFAQILPRLYGLGANTPTTHYEFFRCREIRVEKLSADKPLKVEMDGETHGEADVTFRVLPGILVLSA